MRSIGGQKTRSTRKKKVAAERDNGGKEIYKNKIAEPARKKVEGKRKSYAAMMEASPQSNVVHAVLNARQQLRGGNVLIFT